MTSTSRVAIVGECMLEISADAAGFSHARVPAALSYGGDTLNTAVYLARLGVAADYVTALGDDSLSDWMVDQWRGEGVGCDLVVREKGGVPGVYMIQTDVSGERTFLYWRDNAPARRLFDDESAASSLFDKLAGSDLIYLSGITLALYSGDALQRFMRFLQRYRGAGGKIVFDGNYRPRLWRSVSHSREAFEAMYRLADIALPTLEDELALFGDEDDKAVVGRLQNWGVAEIALKMGAEGCLAVSGSHLELVESREVEVVDTTAAGDSFNAAYIGATLAGCAPGEAAAAGHALASTVIQHRGAIIPLESMPAALATSQVSG